jgi:SAM-dependent methyltransferase
MSEYHPLPHSEPSPALEDIYTFGYGPTAVQIMTSRSAEDSARFFLPYLRAGMRVLDCGCGPGSITVGLAQAVAPGEVVGIDVEPSQIALAQTYAAERGIANARFETGNVSALPFPDATFDAAFGHTIVMQFRDPVQVALSPAYSMTVGTPEQRRVMSEVTARFCEEVAFIEQARALGWVDEGARARLSAALRAEGARADGFFAVALCEVIGWKEGPPP